MAALPFLFLFLLISSSLSVASPPPPHTCSSSSSNHRHECPPFSSPPTAFPFSVSPGCGHPSFRIHCSSPHSIITINSAPFLILSYNTSDSSFTLSPTTTTTTNTNPPCPPLPSHPINLSSSPFRLASDPCPRLSPPCCTTPPPPSFCNFSSWELNLLSNPHALFPNCTSNSLPHQKCAGAAANSSLDILSSFIHDGIRVHWDLSSDPYTTNCSSCSSVANGLCGFNDTDPSNPFLCFPSLDHLDSRSRSSSVATRRLLLLITAVFVSACVFLVIASVYLLGKRRRSCSGGGAAAGANPMASIFLRHHPPVFTYEQLRVSTNGFDPRRKIGDGGFGSVYLAQLHDGRIAAVKRLHRQQPAATAKSFCNEILILSSLRHPNLVRLHGYCWDPRGLLLVYDYVPNGTLADHLHGSRSLYRKGSLTWQVRVDIALQTASALEYLHFSLEPPVVHRDITSNNIFVERDMKIKVGDFGLSRLLSLPEPNSVSADGSPDEYVCCTGPQGTPGYLDPEYHRSFRLTEKSDVYSFGVVLLELVTGMKAVDLRRDKRDVSLADLVVSKIQVGKLCEVVDPLLLREQEGAMGTVEAVAELAFRCVAAEKDDRPNSRELLEELKRIRGQIQELGGKGT